MHYLSIRSLHEHTSDGANVSEKSWKQFRSHE